MRTARSWFSLAVIFLFVGGVVIPGSASVQSDDHPYGPRGAPKNPALKPPGGAPPRGAPPSKGSNGSISYSNTPLTPAERTAAIAADPNGQGYTEQHGNTITHHSLSKKQEEAIAALHGKNSGDEGGKPPKNLSGAVDSAKNAIAKAENDIAKAKVDEQKNHTAEIAAANDIRNSDDRARVLAAIPGTQEYKAVHAVQQTAAAAAANQANKFKKKTPLQALVAAVTEAEASRGKSATIDAAVEAAGGAATTARAVAWGKANTPTGAGGGAPNKVPKARPTANPNSDAGLGWIKPGTPMGSVTVTVEHERQTASASGSIASPYGRAGGAGFGIGEPNRKQVSPKPISDAQKKKAADRAAKTRAGSISAPGGSLFGQGVPQVDHSSDAGVVQGQGR